MKVGFLSVEYQTVDPRTAKMALFDSCHSADLFVTTEVGEIDGAINMLRAVAAVKQRHLSRARIYGLVLYR